MTFDEAVDKCGWNNCSQIQILLEYIENQQSPEGFEDFLDEAVSREETMSKDEEINDAIQKSKELRHDIQNFLSRL